MSAVVAVGPSLAGDRAALTYRERKERERAKRRAAAWERVRAAVDVEAVPDPLGGAPARGRLGTIALVVAGSLTIHILVAFVATVLRRDPPQPRDSYEQAVQVQMADAPKPAAPAPSPIEPAPPPAKTPLVVTPKKLKQDLPPPDPINAETPPPEPPKEPVRRVIGIEMESTTVAGASAFAAGNTRMGKTDVVAQDPTGLERLAPELVPPKRTSAPLPAYPASLRAQGIEGDVQLEVEIAATGRVSNVTVVVPSEHDEFNRSAADAASRGTYEPARLNGVAVTRSITFTVQFRLHS
jgi:periplasmic protein TonB